MQFETLRIEFAPGTEPAEGIKMLVINRPDVMNAMNTLMYHEMRVALQQLAYDDSLRVLILAGEGTRAFSAGGDLKERNGMSDQVWRKQHQIIEEVFLGVKDFPLPVIAAVEGHAHGGGFELAMMTDFIVASETATFSLAEIKRGIMPGGGGIQNLVRAAGMRRAKQLLYTGDKFSGAEAAHWGVVNELTEPGGAVAAAITIARRIVESAPMSVRYTKLSASRGGEVDFHTGYAFDIAAYNVLVSTNDRLEGVAAFNEKRPPRWTNT